MLETLETASSPGHCIRSEHLLTFLLETPEMPNMAESDSGRYILGIDPGFSGGISVLDVETGNLELCIPMPINEAITLITGKELKKTVNAHALFMSLLPYSPFILFAVLEEVGAMPGQGVVSMFRFGEGYGVVQGVLGAMEILVRKVRPAVWKSAMGLNSNKTSSLTQSASLWPDQFHIWSKKKNDGLAESALLAEYGRRLAPKHAVNAGPKMDSIDDLF